jgi:hypothetical protein
VQRGAAQQRRGEAACRQRRGAPSSCQRCLCTLTLRRPRRRASHEMLDRRSQRASLTACLSPHSGLAAGTPPEAEPPLLPLSSCARRAACSAPVFTRAPRAGQPAPRHLTAAHAPPPSLLPRGASLVSAHRLASLLHVNRHAQGAPLVLGAGAALRLRRTGRRRGRSSAALLRAAAVVLGVRCRAAPASCAAPEPTRHGAAPRRAWAARRQEARDAVSRSPWLPCASATWAALPCCRRERPTTNS